MVTGWDVVILRGGKGEEGREGEKLRRCVCGGFGSGFGSEGGERGVFAGERMLGVRLLCRDYVFTDVLG
jgi:hypothetical protein